jgi:phage FluMu protein Com
LRLRVPRRGGRCPQRSQIGPVIDDARWAMKCEACGKYGTLDIRATLIRCSFCDAEWGRVNGFWVESKPPRCMECGGDGKTVEAEPQTCPACAGTGREGGIETSPPLPLADAPPSPCGGPCDHESPYRRMTWAKKN